MDKYIQKLYIGKNEKEFVAFQGDNMHRKRGVSPVIAVLLMIAITIAIGVLVYVWISGLAGSLTKEGGSQVTEQLELVAYDFRDLDQCKIYIKNTGSVKVNITDVYFNGTKLSSTTASNPTSEEYTCVGGTSIDVGDTVTILIGVSGARSGASYIIKVVTGSGGVFTFTVIAGHTG